MITNTGGLIGVLYKLGELLNYVIPVLIALGVVYFVWGVITYVIASDEEAKKTGKYRIIYGIIGLAVIVSVWGLVNILLDTFLIDRGAAPTATQLQNLLP
jgi:predicted membrane channel-forming protein YqfA (hemolysin III family)